MSIFRYEKITTKKLGDNDLRARGMEVYRSLIPTKVNIADDDSMFIANEGDRLDILAQRFYGNSRYWFVLASVNDITNGSVHIVPGTQLRIPNKNRVI